MATDRSGCLGMLFALFGRRAGSPSPTPASETLPYRLRDDFLSLAERSFFGVLQQVVGGQYVICPKVNLADLVFVIRPNENVAARNRIDRKHVDFVLCDPATMRPRVAIELDDSSHRRTEREERDAFVDRVFEAAQLPLVRFPARTAYTLAEVREKLESPDMPQRPTEMLASTVPDGTPPSCPKCGVPMVQRTATRGVNAGQPFYGCPNYPRCRETLPVRVA